MELPAGIRPGEVLGDHLLDDVHEEGHLGLASSLQVLRRADEHGDMRDGQSLAPGQDVFDVLGTVLVAQARVAHAHLPGPASVPVHDEADVAGQSPCCRLSAQTPGVQGVEGIGDTHAGSLHCGCGQVIDPAVLAGSLPWRAYYGSDSTCRVSL